MQNLILQKFTWFIIGALSVFLFVGCSLQSFPHENDVVPTQIASFTESAIVPTFTPTFVPLATFTPVPTVTPVGGSEKIAFKWTDVEDNGKIYLANTDGTDVQTVANIADADYGVGSPRWSPDGEKLTFASITFNGFGTVYHVDGNENDLYEFTSTFASRFGWSNDGKKMFVWRHNPSSANPMQMSVSIVDIEKNNSFQITNNDLDANTLSEGVWSPDDKQIVFQIRTENGLYKHEYDLYLIDINVNGSHSRQLTNNEYIMGGAVEWSLNGDKIFFTSKRDGDVEIYCINIDNSEIYQLTDNDAEESEIDLSPDGQQFVFTSNYEGDKEIYVMDVDGSNVRQLTNNNRDDSFPRWSPDGKQILFSSEINTNMFGMFMMNRDGHNAHRFTDIEASQDFVYAWQPPKLEDSR